MNALIENSFESYNSCRGIRESSIIPILLSSLSATELCLMFLIERDKTNQENIYYRSRFCEVLVEDRKCCNACQELFNNLDHFHSIHMKKPCELFHKESVISVLNENGITQAIGNVTLTVCEESKAENKLEDKKSIFNICKECGELFDDKTLFERHSALEHGKPTMEDNDKSQHEIKQIDENMGVAKGTKTDMGKFCCRYCGESFKTKSKKENHRRKVHSDLIKQQKAEMEESIKRREPKKLQCLFCPKELYKMSVNKHLLTMHFNEKENPKYQEMLESSRTICPECGKDFATTQKYISHLHNEHQETVKKEHLCNICGAGFATTSSLSAHTSVCMHRNYEKYCVECDRTFYTPSSYGFHIREFHSPKLDCTECGKKFSERRLLRHMKVNHVKEKEFPCKECPKQFAFPNKLKGHIQQVHLNLRPYGCEKCIYKASSSYNLNLHRRKMHQSTDQLNKTKLIEMIESGKHPFCGPEFITMLNNSSIH